MDEQLEKRIKKAFLDFLDTEIKFQYTTEQEKQDRRYFLVEKLFQIHQSLLPKLPDAPQSEVFPSQVH